MKQELFVIGDVHGKHQLLLDILKKWDRDRQQLVFVGDLIDRGEDSKSCLELVCRLVREEGAICLQGNHEVMFLAYLADPENRYGHYRRNGGDSTINSLLGRELDAFVDPLVDAQAIRETYGQVVEELKAFPFLYETDRYFIVHAGLDLSLEDVRQTSDYDKVWLRQPFHQGENRTGKTIVFGHTPTDKLFTSPVKTNQIWLSPDGKIGIDGGAVYGGVLQGLVLGDQGPVRAYTVGEKLDFTI